MKIKDIRFRDKKYGWKKFSFVIDLSEVQTNGFQRKIVLSSSLDKNAFIRGFLSDLYLRPSCESCPVKSLKSGSDITIGDFWGYQNNKIVDEDRGISAVLIMTE